MKDYTRNCPNCNKKLFYSSYKNMWRANNKNALCTECVHKLPKNPKLEAYSRYCPNCNKKLFYSSKETLKKSANKQCNSCIQRVLSTGRYHTEETKNKIRQNHSRYWLGKKKPMQEETKNKIRMSTISFIENTTGKCSPRYNPTACKIFEEINSQLQWNGIHAENGGEYHIQELGYWVDYYEPNLNIVIEYDEGYHMRQEEKDKIRQEKIQSLLNCKFIRIKETDNLTNIVTKLKEVL